MKVLIDFYPGAYGPTVRIDVQSLDQLVQLREHFRSLAESRVHEIRLHEMAEVQTIGLTALTLITVQKGQEGSKTFERLSGRDVQFRWARSPEGWADCLARIDRLVEEKKAGHQYLTNEGIDDALVELAFLEPRPPAV